MHTPATAEANHMRQPAVPIEAILFLLIGLMTARIFAEPQLLSLLNNGGTMFFPAMTRPELLIDLFVMVVFLWLVFDRRQPIAMAARRRFWVIVGSTFLIVFLLLCWRIVIRLSNEPTSATHDGILQTEIATRKFLEGENPYVISYEDTLLRKVSISNVPPSNSLLTHFVYPPLLIFSSIPTLWFFDALGLPAELQFIFLCALGVATWLLIRAIPTWPDRTIAFLVTAGNPFIYGYPVAGYNDILMAGLLVIGGVCLANRRWAMSGLAIGLALAAKQTAWFFVPLLVLLLWAWWRQSSPVIRAGVRRCVNWLIITTSILYLPFLVWSAGDLYQDLIRFPAGTIEGSYPIGGSTFWQLKVMADPNHYVFLTTPTQALQLVVALLGLIVAGRRLWRQPQVGAWLIFSAATLLGVGLVSRFNYENYFSALTFVMIAGYLIDRYHPEPPMTGTQRSSIR